MSGDHAHGGRPRKRRESSPTPPAAGCRVTELFQVLGKAHVLDILYIFHAEPVPHRFVDIQGRLRLSPNTLSERLRDLVKAGLLTRTAYNEIPPRVDYQVSEKGLALAPVFESLQAWAEQHDLKRSFVEAPVAA